jgi:hypothetical protein
MELRIFASTYFRNLPRGNGMSALFLILRVEILYEQMIILQFWPSAVVGYVRTLK